MISWSFIITSFIVVVMPGTGVLYTLSKGLSSAKKDTILAAVGCTLGIVPHLLAGVFGLTALLHTSALLFSTIKYIGVAYLIYLGIGMIRSKGFNVDVKTSSQSSLGIIGKAVLINLLNPKLTLFFLSFLPQFMASDSSNYEIQMMILSLFFMGITLLVFLVYGLLAHSFKQLFTESSQLMNRIQKGFGLLFLGLAAKLAFGKE
ncbi:LysE family translocator [Spirochaeta cellobiosiphila]|uniref:LysE family translocator n=1 Tax=Spirochaeta cellobiosiphila TaxID=504483 RepID=UPI00048B0C84|nr:LysE family translocator [Spirochaeta cellobiosiphila]